MDIIGTELHALMPTTDMVGMEVTEVMEESQPIRARQSMEITAMETMTMETLSEVMEVMEVMEIMEAMETYTLASKEPSGTDKLASTQVPISTLALTDTIGTVSPAYTMDPHGTITPPSAPTVNCGMDTLALTRTTICMARD